MNSPKFATTIKAVDWQKYPCIFLVKKAQSTLKKTLKYRNVDYVEKVKVFFFLRTDCAFFSKNFQGKCCLFDFFLVIINSELFIN